MSALGAYTKLSPPESLSSWLHNGLISLSLARFVSLSSTKQITLGNSNVLVTHLGAGIPLLQFCTGHAGRTFANGTEFVGTEKAMKDEMKATWSKVRGEEGARMRAKLAELKEMIRSSWEQGEVRKSTLALGALLAG